MQITTSSPERLSELIGVVYDSALSDRQWKRLMEVICEAFPGCAMTSMASDGEDRAWQYEYAGASPEEIAFVQERLQTSNDLQRLYHREFLALPPGFVARSRKFMGDEAFHATQVYREVLAPMGFGHFMQMKLGDAEERFIYLFLSFREDAPDHERLYDELFRLLALLAPHILRAARIARAMRMSREASRLLGGALDTIILPMAVVDASGALIFANAAGQRCIDRGGVLGMDAEGRLTLPTPQETREFARPAARDRRRRAAGGPAGARGGRAVLAPRDAVLPLARSGGAARRGALRRAAGLCGVHRPDRGRRHRRGAPRGRVRPDPARGGGLPRPPARPRPRRDRGRLRALRQDGAQPGPGDPRKARRGLVPRAVRPARDLPGGEPRLQRGGARGRGGVPRAPRRGPAPHGTAAGRATTGPARPPRPITETPPRRRRCP